MSFTEPSKKLQTFVENVISTPNFHFSPQVISIIEKIYDQAFEGYKSEPKYTEPKIITDFPKGNDYSYMEQSIKTHIEEMEKQIYQVELTVGKRIYNIYFVFYKREKIDIHIYIKKINAWLELATHYSKPSCSKRVNVYLYFTDLKKVFPKRGMAPDQVNANTAFTTSCQSETEIILYRREEWFKVFIHESFHNLGLDFSTMDISSTIQILGEIFKIKSEFKLYETYTEMWAELLNILFINIGIHREKSFSRVLPFVEKHIEIEQKFSLFQCGKILEHFGTTYDEILSGKSNYKENTEVFCYFILKTILLFDPNNFIMWLETHKNEKRQKVEKFAEDLIISKHNEIHFVEALNRAQQVAKKVSHKTFLRDNLRMTCLEVGEP